MSDLDFFTLFAFLLCNLISCTGQYEKVQKFDTVAIEECVPGKYFWRESDPEEFYACLTLSKRAVKMRCSVGTYMCNAGPKVFQACMCKGKPDKSKKSKNDLQLNESPKKSDLLAGRFDQFAKMAADDSSFAEGLNSNSSDGSTSDADAATSGRQADPSNVQWDALPSGGCPDPYKKFSNQHMIGGYGQSFPDLLTCQTVCKETYGCIGIDWNRAPETAGNERCYFIFPESASLDSSGDLVAADCCDHYRRTLCTPEVGTQTSGSHDNQGQRVKASDDAKDGGDDTMLYNSYVKVGNGARAKGSMEPTVPTAAGRQATTTTTQPPPTTQANRNAAPTTIPDSGCPYTFQEFPGVSHPFGQNVTSSSDVDEVEECKFWCLVRAYCQGVDYDANTNTCYYLAQVEPGLVSHGVQGVTHYRKIDCTRPLRCFTYSSDVITSFDMAITNPNTPQTPCNGVCYTRETVGATTNTVERGCMTSSVPVALGCSLSDDLLSVTCFCDTMRCNGLSVIAMATQLLHMPLDDDFSDHSGSNLLASVPTGYNPPDFQCLDKSINCSALFTGSNCIRVTSLSDTEYGVFKSGDLRFSPEATFSVHFKRITGTGMPSPGGIFGNSDDPNIRPSWMITSKQFNNFITAGLTSEETQLASLEDYDYIRALNDDWHLVVMTYDGFFDRTNEQFPRLSVYVDGKAQDGNSGLEKGKIDISSAPVTIGCIAGDNFFGYIDDARIFVTSLSQADIQALTVMRDVNYWY